MITRKNGETDKQFCKRLEAALDNTIENNRALRKLLNEGPALNPRTNRTYKSEAQEMFYTLVFAMDALMQNDERVSALKNLFRGQLISLGFNDLEIETQEILKDEAYTGVK